MDTALQGGLLLMRSETK